jgi:hypothetical protein
MYFDGKMKTKVDAHVLNFSTKSYKYSYLIQIILI